jgi:hypothetical protein
VLFKTQISILSILVACFCCSNSTQRIFNAFFNLARPGLPDGLFSNSQLGQILEGLSWENVAIHILSPFGIFQGHLGYFMTLWYILCSFGTFFLLFGIMHQEKSGNPARDLVLRRQSTFFCFADDERWNRLPVIR